MGFGLRGGDAAARSALQETELEQVGLVVVFNGGGLVAGEGSDGVKADGAVAVILQHQTEHITVGGIKTQLVNLHHLEGGGGNGNVNDAVAVDIGVVADALSEAVGNSRSKAGAGGKQRGGFGSDGGAE